MMDLGTINMNGIVQNSSSWLPSKMDVSVPWNRAPTFAKPFLSVSAAGCTCSASGGIYAAAGRFSYQNWFTYQSLGPAGAKRKQIWLLVLFPQFREHRVILQRRRVPRRRPAAGDVAQ